MHWALILTALSWAPSAKPRLDMTPRVPALLWVAAPLDREVDVSRLLRVGAEALEHRSGLRILSPEQAGIEAATLSDCPRERRLACWTSASSASRAEPLRWLFVLRYEGRGEEGARLTASALDLAAAREIAGRGRSVAATEDALFEALITGPPFELAFASERAEREALIERLRSRLDPVFERLDDRAPAGDVDLDFAAEAMRIEVDGEIVGIGGAEGAELVGVPAGRRQILIWRDRTLRRRCAVAVPAGARVALDADRCPRVSGAAAGSEGSVHALGIAGLGVAALGAVAIVVGASSAAGGPQRVCVRNGPCGGLPWATIGDPTLAGPSADPGATRAGGPGWLPVGLGLTVAGAGAALDGWVVPAEARWWSTLIGVVAGGALAAAVSVAGEP